MRKLAILAMAAMLFAGVPNYDAYAGGYLTVKGEVGLVGGSGNIEDVKLTVQYSGVPEEYKDFYMGTVRWYGSPDENGKFSIKTGAFQGALHQLRVTAELAGYSPVYDVLVFNEDTTDKLVLVSDGRSSAVPISGDIVMENGEALPANLCPTIKIVRSNVIGESKIDACGGSWLCNAAAGQSVTVTPSLSGYTFTPDHITVDNIQEAKGDFRFTMKKVSESQPPKEEPPVDTDNNEKAVVELFQHGNYKGKSLSLEEGRYNINQLGSVGNDQISSVKVPEGYTVTLYQHGDFKGKQLVCTKNITFLGNQKFNDMTSSIVIQKN